LLRLRTFISTHPYVPTCQDACDDAGIASDVNFGVTCGTNEIAVKAHANVIKAVLEHLMASGIQVTYWSVSIQWRCNMSGFHIPGFDEPKEDHSMCPEVVANDLCQDYDEYDGVLA